MYTEMGEDAMIRAKPTLYLCCIMGNYYLSSEQMATSNKKAKYFRVGSKRLFVEMPTWFRSEKEARAKAKAQGFRVVRRKGL